MAVIHIQGAAEKAQGIHYEVDIDQAPLGVGGMGQVFRGFRVDERSGIRRDAAIKFLFDDLPQNAIERSRREASIMISSENLVEMFGFIEVDETDAAGRVTHRYHVASELLDGVVLYDLLRGKITDINGQVIPFAQDLYRQYINDRLAFSIYITKNVLSGIMALHDKGYVHRDIDPSNIMITRNGKVKLIDFGIAKQLSALGQNDRQLTTAGQFMGKAAYAAPELVMGDVAHQNETTDIYAIGIMLYELATGHLPFDGPTHEVLDMQLRMKLPLKDVGNKYLRSIIAKATDKRQQERYASAAEFRVALEQLSRNSLPPQESAPPLPPAVANTPSGPPATMPPRPVEISRSTSGSKSKLPIILGAVAGVVVIAGVLLALLLGGNKNTSDNPQQDSSEQVTERSSVETVTPTSSPTEENAVEQATALLKDASTAQKGVDKLNEAAQNGDTDAMYLLAQVYAHGVNLDDAIKAAIENVVPKDNKKAHELNEKVVKAQPDHYQALYELGCDYMAGDQRGAVDRDLDKARTYFSQGAKIAEEKKDAEFVERFNIRLAALD